MSDTLLNEYAESHILRAAAQILRKMGANHDAEYFINVAVQAVDQAAELWENKICHCGHVIHEHRLGFHVQRACRLCACDKYNP